MKTTMQTKNCFILVACLVLILAAGVAAQRGSQRTVAVIAQPPRQHIPDFHLTDILCDALLMYGGLDVVYPGNDSNVPLVPDAKFNLKQLVAWGQEMGVRYIIYLQVNSRKIVREKSVSIPLILSRYVIEGRVDGTYILVDVQHGKQTATFNLDTDRKSVV